MKCIHSGQILLTSLLACGCSVVTYDLRHELAEVRHPGHCEIAFALELKSGHGTSSLGATTHEPEEVERIRRGYVDRTVDTLDGLGCGAGEASGDVEPNLSIIVDRQLQLSALPQEWLTGLSFGLIPSWGTKYGQYTFTFTNADTAHTHTYVVDQRDYNHLVLFPVFWVTFFTANEHRAYANALANFAKSS